MSKMKDFLIDQLEHAIDPTEEDMGATILDPEYLNKLQKMKAGPEEMSMGRKSAINIGVGTVVEMGSVQESTVAQIAKEIMEQHEVILRKLQDSTDAQRLEMLLEVLKKHEPAIVDLAQQAYNSPYTNLSVHKSYVWAIECLLNRLRLEQIG